MLSIWCGSAESAAFFRFIRLHLEHAFVYWWWYAQWWNFHWSWSFRSWWESWSHTDLNYHQCSQKSKHTLKQKQNCQNTCNVASRCVPITKFAQSSLLSKRKRRSTHHTSYINAVPLCWLAPPFTSRHLQQALTKCPSYPGVSARNTSVNLSCKTIQWHVSSFVLACPLLPQQVINFCGIYHTH